jgi:hypothetical protein
MSASAPSRLSLVQRARGRAQPATSCGERARSQQRAAAGGTGPASGPRRWARPRAAWRRGRWAGGRCWRSRSSPASSARPPTTTWAAPTTSASPCGAPPLPRPAAARAPSLNGLASTGRRGACCRAPPCTSSCLVVGSAPRDFPLGAGCWPSSRNMKRMAPRCAASRVASGSAPRSACAAAQGAHGQALASQRVCVTFRVVKTLQCVQVEGGGPGLPGRRARHVPGGRGRAALRRRARGGVLAPDAALRGRAGSRRVRRCWRQRGAPPPPAGARRWVQPAARAVRGRSVLEYSSQRFVRGSARPHHRALELRAGASGRAGARCGQPGGAGRGPTRAALPQAGGAHWLSEKRDEEPVPPVPPSGPAMPDDKMYASGTSHETPLPSAPIEVRRPRVQSKHSDQHARLLTPANGGAAPPRQDSCTAGACRTRFRMGGPAAGVSARGCAAPGAQRQGARAEPAGRAPAPARGRPAPGRGAARAPQGKEAAIGVRVAYTLSPDGAVRCDWALDARAALPAKLAGYLFPCARALSRWPRRGPFLGCVCARAARALWLPRSTFATVSACGGSQPAAARPHEHALRRMAAG